MADVPQKSENNRDAKGRFVKGNLANPGGRPAGTISLKRLFIDKLKETIKAEGAFKGRPYSEAVIHKWLEAIIKGEPWALKLALAYVDGLPVQPISGPDGGAVAVSIAELEGLKGLDARELMQLYTETLTKSRSPQPESAAAGAGSGDGEPGHPVVGK